MKIAYVINSLEGGGAAFPVPAIATALRDCGSEVEIFALTRRDGRALPAMTGAGLTVHVRKGGEKDHWAANRWLRSVLAQYRPDAVWTSLTRATLLGQRAAAARKVPVVSWQHAAYLRPANQRLLRMMRNRSKIWVADSDSVAEFSRKALGVPEERLIVWPIFAAKEDTPQAMPWTTGETLRIGSLGRLHRVKGYDVLIAALKILHESNPPDRGLHLTIGGTGTELEDLKALILEAGLDNVELAGFIGEPAQFLASQHLYVQPSRSEGFCLAAHEAMQAGLPVIGSSVGEMAHSIINGVTGLLVEPDDPQSLAAAIRFSLNHPKNLRGMGQAGRARLLERFNPASFRAKAGEILQRLGEPCQSGR
ncbi:glycosyltransferase family 4 protein [Sphingomonas sp.]|uniref:glycosyltransferase family 4 protein n=1 Tax=Sphingomonas sp. TaxID=28214 RepID=UPI0025FFA1B7|nr:glycosyltransferase family 4 protein [Sphingomonas sp.]